MSILKEFKTFAIKGNVLDLAIGVIIGGAFGKIVTSAVNDVIMPPIGLLLGKVDFKNLFINMGPTKYATLAEAQQAGAPTLNYGIFLNQVIDFLIVAAVVFVIVRQVNRWKPKEAAKAPATKECPYCLSTIPVKATRCGHCTSDLA